MISQRSAFKLLNKGHGDTILLIPGWATDYRIFDNLNLPFNYLLPIVFSPHDFQTPLLKALDEMGISKISIFGWSMGGYVAVSLVMRYPERFKDVTLVGLRPRYDKKIIEDIKAHIRKSRAGYLYKFYSDCFSKNEKREWAHFKRTRLRTYLRESNPDTLLSGLDYLSKSELRPNEIEDLDITFVHGDADKIAPIAEMLAFTKSLPRAKFVIIEGAGHLPFLTPGVHFFAAPQGSEKG